VGGKWIGCYFELTEGFGDRIALLVNCKKFISLRAAGSNQVNLERLAFTAGIEYRACGVFENDLFGIKITCQGRAYLIAFPFWDQLPGYIIVVVENFIFFGIWGVFICFVIFIKGIFTRIAECYPIFIIQGVELFCYIFVPGGLVSVCLAYLIDSISCCL
jgi:hypothetical protein